MGESRKVETRLDKLMRTAFELYKHDLLSTRTWHRGINSDILRDALASFLEAKGNYIQKAAKYLGIELRIFDGTAHTTDELRPQASLQRQVQYSKTALPGLVAHIETDARGLTTKIDDAFTEMCGYRLPELRGKKPGHLLQGPKTEESVVSRLREAVKAGKRFSGTITNYRKDGSLYRAEIKMSPIYKQKKLVGFRAEERIV